MSTLRRYSSWGQCWHRCTALYLFVFKVFRLYVILVDLGCTRIFRNQLNGKLAARFLWQDSYACMISLPLQNKRISSPWISRRDCSCDQHDPRESAFDCEGLVPHERRSLDCCCLCSHLTWIGRTAVLIPPNIAHN